MRRERNKQRDPFIHAEEFILIQTAASSVISVKLKLANKNLILLTNESK